MIPKETWTDVVETSWNRPDSLARIFKDAPAYLRNTLESEKAITLEEILTKRKGLFTFFRQVPKDIPKEQKQDITNAVIAAFKLLQFLIEFFTNQFRDYVEETKIICSRFIQCDVPFDIGYSASCVLKNLIKHFDYCGTNLVDILNDYQNIQNYIVIGAIARYCPKIIQNIDSISGIPYSDELYKQLIIYLKNECDKKAYLINTKNVQIFLECFTDLTKNFFPFERETNQKHNTNYIQDLYKNCYELCNSNVIENKSPDLVEQVAFVLISNIELFSSFFFNHTVSWHQLFVKKFRVQRNNFWTKILETFYESVSMFLSKEYKEDMFEYFTNFFKSNLANLESSSSEIGLSIFGLGQFSVLYANYPPDITQEVLQRIISHTSVFFTKKEFQDIELLPYYVQALALTLKYTSKVSYQNLDYLIQLSILIFKNYAKVNEETQINSISSLKRTFVCVKKFEKKLQNYYFCSVFEKGILSSCCNILYVDVELQMEIQYLSEQPISYKNYVSLWISLFSETSFEEKTLNEIFQKWVKTYFVLISRLNLKIVNETLKDKPHFRCFLNLVDLSTEIFEKIDISFIEICAETILLNFTKYSYKFAKISAFYIILKTIFKKLGITYHYEDKLSTSTSELISGYLIDVLKLIPEFTGELQLSCIGLIFNAPIFFVKDFVYAAVPVLKLALEIGLSNTNMAFMTLEVLEIWCNYFDSNKHLNDFYDNIAFYLEPYLVNTKKLHIDNEDYEILQKKILLCLGTSKFNKIQDFIHRDSSKISTKWNERLKLYSKFTFSKDEIELNFERLLVKIIELTKSQIRAIRFSNCELLHTFVTMIIGRKQYHLYAKLFSVILKLSCDTDDAVRNLFHPLALQSIHCISKMKFKFTVSQQILDILFDEMADESMQLYCSLYLKECVIEIPSKNLEEQTNFLTNLIYRIENLALHPLKSKRIAAAVAFNNLHNFFGNNLVIFNLHWLHLFYVFVKSLEFCKVECHSQINDAINNIYSQIEKNPNILNGRCKNKRRVPTEFMHDTLKGALMWLLDKCASENVICRYKSMELFEKICELVPEYKSVAKFFQTSNLDLINNIALKGLDSCINITIDNAKAFFKSLDFYIWIFKNKIVSPEVLLVIKSEQSGKYIFLTFFSKFISIIVHQNINNVIKESEYSSGFFEKENLKDLINKIILKIFLFIKTTLIVIESNMLSSILLDNLFVEDLNIFVSFFIFSPQKLGLTQKTLLIVESTQQENLFQTIMEKLPEKYLVNLKKILTMVANEYREIFLEFEDTFNDKLEIITLHYFVQGITVIDKIKFLNFKNEFEITDDIINNKIDVIFKLLTTNYLNGTVNKEYDDEITNYLVKILNYLLLEYNTVVMDFLIKKIVFNLTTNKSISFIHHDHVFVMLKSPIYQFLLKKPIETIKVIEEHTINQNLIGTFFQVIEDLLSFIKENKIIQKDFGNELIKKFGMYRTIIENDEQVKDKLFDVYCIAVSLSHDQVAISDNGETSDLYNFIMKELKDTTNYEKKLEILENFCSYIIDSSSRRQLELKFTLRELWDKNLSSWILKLENDELERSRATQCLRCLMRLLSITDAYLILEIIIMYIAGTGKFFKQEKLDESLQSYLILHPHRARNTVKVVFDIFIDIHSLNWHERLDILDYILLPSLKFATDVIIEFYNEKVRDIGIKIVEKNLDEMVGNDRSNEIITRIGYFKLTELSVSEASVQSDMIKVCDVDEKSMFVVCNVNDDKELVRQLNCSVLNCLIAISDTNDDNRPFILIQHPAQKTNLFQRTNFWPRIIDSERLYNMRCLPKTFSKHIVTIRHTIRSKKCENKRIFNARLNKYFLPLSDDLDKMAYVDDYEGNYVILEDDELNSHECMPMLTALWMYLINNEIVQVTTERLNQADPWMENLCIALRQSDNITLFVLRLLSNLNTAFLPFLPLIFVDLAIAISSYLKIHPINYLVRDMMVMLAQINLLFDAGMFIVAQDLVESLLDRAVDDNFEIYKYNIFLIDELVKCWAENLKVFKNLETHIDKNPNLAMRIILMMFKYNVDHQKLLKLDFINPFVMKYVRRWRNPIVEITFEVFGYILKNNSEEIRNAVVQDLVPILKDMEKMIPYPPYKSGRDCCVRQLYLMCKSCCDLTKHDVLKPFMNPKTVYDSQHKVECLEMLFESLKKPLEEKKIEIVLNILEQMDLISMLYERLLLCLEIIFEIIHTLVDSLPPLLILPYLFALELFVKDNTKLKIRKKVYNIFSDLYKKYSQDTSPSSEEQIVILNICKKVLVNGIMDPSHEIKKYIISTWENKMKTDLTVYLADLLSMFDLHVASSFAQFLSSMLLELIIVSTSDVKPLFKDINKDSRDYKVATPRLRLQASKNRIPRYSPSLAKKLENVVIVQSCFNDSNVPLHKALEEGSIGHAVIEKLTRSNDVSEIFKNIQDPSEVAMSNRSFSKETESHSFLDDYYATIKKEFAEINNNVTVNRSHKIAYFPYIQIFHKDVIITLQDLALRDRYFAGELTEILLCSIINYFTNTEMYDDVVDKIIAVCHQALEKPNDFAPVAINILHRSGATDFETNKVMRIAKSMNLEISGILLLERNSISRGEFIYDVGKNIQNLKHNVELLNMYQSINERDVVQSILKNWLNSLNSVQLYQAYKAEEAKEFDKAITIYKGIDDEKPVQDFCTESIYRCLIKLSNWDKLKTELNNSVENEDVWQHPNKDEILPWMFMSELQSILEDIIKNAESEIHFFNNAIQISSTQTDILSRFGEELAIFNLFNDDPIKSSVTHSKNLLNRCLSYVRDKWINAHSFTEELKLQLVEKLGRIADADTCFRTLCSDSTINGLNELIRYLNANQPEPGSRLVNWNMRVNCRLGTLRIFHETLKSTFVDSDIIMSLLETDIKQRFKLSKLALDYNNKKVLKKQNIQIEKALHHFDSGELCYKELEHEFQYIAAKYKLLCAEVESEVKKKFDYYVESWKLAGQVINDDDVNTSLKIKTMLHGAKVMEALYNVANQDSRYLLLAAKEEFVMNSLNVQDPALIKGRLQASYSDILRNVCTEGDEKEKIDNLVLFANYCHQLLLEYYHRTSHVQKEYINTVLTAMTYGSTKAVRFFPDLLNYETYQDNIEFIELFVTKCTCIPSYIFLKCYKEIFSHLETPHNNLREQLILPIVEKLVKDYPSTIMYKFAEMWFTDPILRNPELRNPELQQLLKKSEEHKNQLQELSANDKIVNMFNTVFNKQIKSFFDALVFLLPPEEYIILHLSKVLQNDQTKTSILKALKAISAQVDFDINSKLISSMFSQILMEFVEKLKGWIQTPDRNLLTAIQNFCTSLHSDMCLRLENDKLQESMLLQSYSPVLADFSFEKFEIEVPGLQNKFTQPYNRVLIAKIDSFVDIIKRFDQYYLKINIIGTNGKNYKFLVKYGADLRQDERIQELFRFMNNTLQTDPKCIERHLYTYTYSIVPVNKQLSLVQWIKNAKSLRNLIESNNINKILETTSTNYQAWIDEADKENPSMSKRYKQALLKYTSAEIENKMKEFINNLKWDVLRKAFVKITPSIECFCKLRHNFIKYYAVLCATDWIAGVGDRRLETILIDKSSGQCFGTDFQMVFGTGVSHPIPELVPFRLTAQILGLFRPFTGKDLFGTTIAHILTALKKDNNLILAYSKMLLFGNLKWDEEVKKQWLSDNHEYRGDLKFKYEIIRRKLNGDKPSLIMIDELSQNHSDDQYFALCKCILNGREFLCDNVRGRLPSFNLTPEEQALCLVDQATDIHIIGRMFVNWCPFV